MAEVPPPEALHGTLRPYQVRGLGWLAFLARYGLGACLADDMGLGKCVLRGTRVSTLAGPASIESFWELPFTAVTPDGEGGEWGTLARPILVHTVEGCEIKAAPVRRVYRQEIAEECIQVEVSDGVRLSCTRRHRVLTPTGWKTAGALHVGDLVGVCAQTPRVGGKAMAPAGAALRAGPLCAGPLCTGPLCAGRERDHVAGGGITSGHPARTDWREAPASPGVSWCTVTAITRFQHVGYVYDLEVPLTHNYLANGIVTHNTVELLSLVLHQKAAGLLSKPVLLVCPTSVVGNWRHETARFAPTLRVLVHHGAARVGRAAAQSFAAEVADYDLVVTTYSLLPRDVDTLATAAWGAVVLDEAQNIKNVEAKQSRAARKLRAPIRIALTGTPVENRLAELWSIMDFLNPGYFGSHKHFNEHLAQPIERLRDPEATARLQALARPFILRRVKTDPAVISDLPEKLEIREYCPLTREQVTLYEAVVRDGLRQLEAARGQMQRRGTVLALLSKLKQVCNHPAHFLGDDSALAGRSGKLTRLEELVEELLGEGDRALIFTQFTAMGDRLHPYLRERFGVDVLYLHGGVPQVQRERLVAHFQASDGPPLFLLSLKAGGTGLNLTRATHVIHFDRWWNPAVENQATDRAFRIGQTRNVQVRKFVCTGTLEERIDAMIEQKRELAEQVIGTGEAWITELSTAQLRDLFSLRADALAE
jgi:SNF2 family DNA or RNA helicase